MNPATPPEQDEELASPRARHANEQKAHLSDAPSAFV